MKRTNLLCLLGLAVLLQNPYAQAAEDDPRQSEEYRIGVMVKAIQLALRHSEEKTSLETIAEYGLDSRYYVMIRGWLVQELAGVRSQFEATRENSERKKELKARVEFLQQAIRRIDLE